MKHHSNPYTKPIYIIDGCRTPFLKAKGIGDFSASDLATVAGKHLLNRQVFSQKDLDAVVLGCVMPNADEANIARLVALRIGCDIHTPAYTVMRNCASGLQAIDTAAMEIAQGRAKLVLAGGTEAMSRAPVLFNLQMMRWMAKWYQTRHTLSRVRLLTQCRLSYLKPVMALLQGLNDPLIGLNMGQTAEELAFRFDITREAMDDFAVASHIKATNAYAEHRMTEVCPIINNNGEVFAEDNGIRQDSTIEKLATLKPFFDKKFGQVTAGNSSQITDGACLLLLASEDIVKQYALPVLGRIVDVQWAGLDPRYMGLGPVYAMAPLLKRQQCTLSDIDTFEINEAFAAQVLACLKALEDEVFCRDELGTTEALGSLHQDKLNPDGGAIALGHPVGASGARLVLHALHTLKQNHQQKALVSICIGGGQGGAMYLEYIGGQL